MKIEHRLSPTVAAYAAKALGQLRELRTQYLAALGQAKEAELQSVMVQRALEQQLAIVEQSEKLPPAAQGYALSADGAMLLGETESPAAAAPVSVIAGNGVQHA